MSVGLPSDEVAEDYKNSLEDLTMNSRYEISNLTVIAKENTEHAMAISRVLENHIRNVSNLCPSALRREGSLNLQLWAPRATIWVSLLLEQVH